MSSQSPKPPSFDKSNFYSYCDILAERDRIFRSVIDEHGYPKLFSRAPTFSTLVQIILEQQVSLASARAVFERLQERLGALSAGPMAKIDDSVLKACGVTRQKTVYIKDLARAVAGKSLLLGALYSKGDDEVRAELTEIKGIGNWSADVYMMMALHRLDCFPGADIALIKSARELMGLPATQGRDEVLKIAESWRPYRTVAAFMLWWSYIKKRNIKV